MVFNVLDYKVVKFKLNGLNNKRGLGLWKFNNFFLDDEDYVILIRENYFFISEKYFG